MRSLTPARFLSLSLVLSFPVCIVAQGPSGYWEGDMVQQGSVLPVAIVLLRGPSGLTGTWSAPSMRALDVPLTAIRFEGRSVHFELAGDQSSTVFDGMIRGDSLVGRFTGGEGEGTFAVARRAPPPLGYREEEVRFTNGVVQLAGTLLLPLTPGRHPALVLVHGSGPEGRHGSRFLADHLARPTGSPH